MAAPRRGAAAGRRATATERRLWRVTAVLALAVALVVGVAVVAQGYERSEQDLSAADVWVTRTSSAQLGRANTALPALDTAVKLSGDGATVAQDADHVVLHSAAENTLTVMDPAAAEPLGSVNLPAGSPQVATAGSWLAVLDPTEGDVWVRTLGEVQGFDVGQEPDGQAGADAVVAVDQEGRWAAFSRASSRVSVGGAGRETTVREVPFSGGTDRVQVAMVGGEPVVYDEATAELYAHGRVRALASVLPDPDSVRLMGSASEAEDMTLASDTGLVSVPSGGDDVELPVDDVSGTPAAPVWVAGCWYGAWSEGTAMQWCQGRDPETFALDGASGAVTLRSNGDSVVANDAEGGRSWALQDGGAVIDNWDDFSRSERTVTREREDLDTPPTPVRTQRAPQLEDDEFGARPGRANVLPVLLNDADPNGDPLLITAVSRIPAPQGSVEIVENGQKLQFTARPEASGTVRMRYTADDGHGHHATAMVTVRLVGDDENHAPQQRRATRTTVVRQGHASLQVLDDWVDPESDPIYLAGASADGPDTATSDPQGQVDFTHGGGDPGVDTVRLRVSDGTAVGEGKASVTVRAKGQAPIIAENTTLTGVVGTQLSVVPTELARGGDAELTLARAEVSSGTVRDLGISVTYSDGSVRLQPRAAGSYELTYSVTDGHASASGTIRVVITAPPSGAGQPVVSPTTAFLYLKNTTDVDVLAHASDPSGAVLSLSAVQDAPAGSGVLTEIVDQKRLRVTLKRGLTRPLTLDVTVSNGEAEAKGRLTLVQIPEPSRLQAPVARDDHATVRAGEVLDLNVLDNDEQPDGKPIELRRALSQEPEAGLLVVSGDRLRYLAPSEPGTYTGRYTIAGPDGQTASAQVAITVTAVDAAENRAPSAPDVTARARAGQPVKIPIPVTGADPDGDAVTVTAITEAPEHGTVTEVGSDEITYVPNEQTAGTDVLGYRMVDALGATAVGSVRVGVQPSDATTAPPVAEDDLVTTRPGTALSVDVTENDSDPAGRGLRVAGVEAQPDGVKATAHGGSIDVRVPQRPGTVAIMYRVQDAAGAQSYAWLTIDVRRDAPLAAPRTQDSTLTLSDIAAREEVPVDVLATTEFAEGGRDDLSVSLPEGWSAAHVDASGNVVVPVTATRQVIPFTVSRTDAPRVGSTSFITVPGTDEAPPERRTDAPALEVTSGETLHIPLSEQVIAAQDRTVAVTDASTVHATNGKGDAPRSGTLTFQAPESFWGQASISATVTDGRTSATILLPITVRPAQDPAPTIRAASVSVEAGGSTTFDLRADTDYAGSDPNGLRFGADGGDAALVRTRTSGQTLVLTAADGAEAGGRTTVRIWVSDAAGRRSEAELDVAVVASRKPPPLARDDTTTLRRGQSTDVAVLANDVSPFSGRSLSLKSVDTGTAVSGVSARLHGSRITVSAGEDADTGTATFVYTVEDVTGDDSRQAQGLLQVRVQDVPGAPAGAPAVTEQPETASVVLSVRGADPNGAAVTGYEYRVNGDDSTIASCGDDPGACRVSGLPYGTDLRFEVRARNELGAGAFSAPSATVMMDHAPGTPRDVTGRPSDSDRDGTTLSLRWKAPAASPYGTAVRGYDVRVSGPGLPSGGIQRSTEGAALSFHDTRLRAGSSYSIAVTARNARMASDAGTTTVRAVGAPIISHAAAGLTGDGARAQVSWDADGRGGEARARVLSRSQASGSGCSAQGFELTTDGQSYTTTLKPGQDTRFVVEVSNGLFCTRAATTEIDTRVGAPEGRTWAVDDRDGDRQGTQPHYELKAGTPAGSYTFVLLGDSSRPSDTAAGWHQADLGSDTEFGENGEDVTVWAMSCRTSDRLFCSTVARIGTEQAASVDLGYAVDAPEQCTADGSTTITVTPRAEATEVKYQWRDEDGKVVDPVPAGWARTPEDGRVVVPSREEGEDVSLYVRTDADGFTYDPNTAEVKCSGPAEASSDGTESADAGAPPASDTAG